MPPSELLDFARDVPASPEDVVALRRLRQAVNAASLADLELLAPSWPAPPDVAARPTAQGREPFEL